MDVQDLEAIRRQRLERVERVERRRRDVFLVTAERRARARERVGRVVAEDELDLVVIARAVRFVVRLEAVNPRGRSRARADANFENWNFGRQLVLRFELFQELPE